MPPPAISAPPRPPPHLYSSACFAKYHILLLLALFASYCHAFIPKAQYTPAPPPSQIQNASISPYAAETNQTIPSISPYAAETNQTIPSCAFSAFCGEINISYPFWLSHADPANNKSSAAYCGYQGLELFCQNNKTILRVRSDSYTVISIDYATHTLSLADSDVLGKQCPRVRHNLTFDDQSNLGYDHEYDANLTFFFDCTVDAQLRAKISSHEIDCLRNGTSRSFVFNDSVLAPHPPEFYGLTSPGVCLDVVVAPVLLKALPSDVSSIPLSFGEALQQGFQLTWAQSGDCAKCESSGGRCGLNQRTNTSFVFTCFCPDGLVKFPDCKNDAEHKILSKTKMIIVIGFALALGSLSLFCIFLFLRFQHHKSSHGMHIRRRVQEFLNEHASLTPRRYKYSEIKKMTRSFSNKLGHGGYGTVYKGTLRDGHLVAVKILSDGSRGDGEEFINEVASICRTSHVNIVNLVGFCIKGSKRALIYDFMPNGSLDKFISSSDHEETKNSGPSLDWEQLHQIAVGIARGLEYLHRGCNTRIVHFDIKPHNILLDQDFCPKIADFGLAKLGRPKESRISMTGARGTIGYIAPEVFSRNFGTVSSKSDVYSYGMMVLEMVGAKRRRITETVGSSSEIYFPHCVYDNLDEYCKIESSIPQIGNGSEELVRRMIIVGLWCIQMVPANRPTMNMVLDMLEGNEDLEMPPRP